MLRPGKQRGPEKYWLNQYGVIGLVQSEILPALFWDRYSRENKTKFQAIEVSAEKEQGRPTIGCRYSNAT